MSSAALWIVGPPRSGKTSRLIQQVCQWSDAAAHSAADPGATVLVFAATGDNRMDLADRIAEATQGRDRFDSTTPLGFFQDEVVLFWPLLVQQLNLKAQFPLRLRPETEQELATRLWQPLLESEQLQQAGVPTYYLVRRTLDLLQLAAVNGTPPDEIGAMLQDGFPDQAEAPELWQTMQEALLQWRTWCLDRGLLTYGLISELYWRYLLPHPDYQLQLQRRYRAVLADDVDEYPAIARALFERLLDLGLDAAFTYSPDGAVRLGLGANPQALAGLADRCQVELLAVQPTRGLGAEWGQSLVAWVENPLLLPTLPAAMGSIQTVSRGQQLRRTAEVIIQAVHSGQVRLQDVAVIGPGLDPIARYTLREILTSKGIPVEALNDQQPLISSPTIRALLTLMALIYPGLGRLLNREAIAEMLVVLSQPPTTEAEASSLALAHIDPVRAGLLTDHCFVPDPDHPHLLPATAFPRWDRLGHRAAQVYGDILQWIDTQKSQQQQRLIPSPVTLLDRAIQRFLYGGSHLPFDQLAALRELMETAQHYWEVDSRLRQREHPSNSALERFICLLRNGTITADPYPVRPFGQEAEAVTLATIFQYRSYRRHHRWQFWLDAGSALWLTGGGGLFGAPLFLQGWSGRPWSAADALQADQQRLQRQVLDLLCRADERVYLCHSELATNGQEQTGPMLALVNAAPVVEPEPALEL